MIFKNTKIRMAVVGLFAIGGIALISSLGGGGGGEDSDVPTFEVQRGDLEINVLQGGEVQALRNEEIKSEIESTTKIMSLVPEGYMVTGRDIEEEKVLVELDNSDLKLRIQDHEIDFQSTVASYIEADEAREITRSENLSRLREERQEALFSLMDFEKYLGSEVATEILSKTGLPSSADSFDRFAAALEAEGEREQETDVEAVAEEEDSAASDLLDEAEPSERVNYTQLLEQGKLSDGEAQQMLRKLEDQGLLTQSELAVAKQKVEASERLAAKDFVSQAELENDQVNFEKVSLSVKTAETELDLFKTYEFPRQAEELLSNYREDLNGLRRTVRANRSRMAQAESRFQSAKRRYDMELAKKEDLERQLTACTILASTPGLVAYGDLDASAYTRYNESIEEGASIRLRQTILTIPDMSHMGVNVKIHESQVKKVKIGQRALIQVDAEPDKILTGRVAELAVLPDSASSRYTPNLKVYPCTIHIDGTHPWLKPGMNAKVEVVVEELSDVVFVPVQSIEVQDDIHYCYVMNGADLERREVATGSFNDDFIEVRDGLTPGDQVALSLPEQPVADAPKSSMASNLQKRADETAKTSKPKVASN